VNEEQLYRISRVLQKPYRVDLKRLEIPAEYWKSIFKFIYGNDIIYEFDVETDESMFIHSGSFPQHSMLYYEDSDGDWVERKYDEDGNLVSYEDPDGKAYVNQINESYDNKVDKYLDKVVDFLIKDTKYKVTHDSFGFNPNYKEIKVIIKFPMYSDSGHYPKHEIEDWDAAEVNDREYNYFSDNYGLGWEESQIVFLKYILKLKDILLGEIKLKYGN